MLYTCTVQYTSTPLIKLLFALLFSKIFANDVLSTGGEEEGRGRGRGRVGEGKGGGGRGGDGWDCHIPGGPQNFTPPTSCGKEFH